MLQYPDIDPVAISLGPLQIHWYGIMYLIGFGAGWALANRRAQKGDAALFATPSGTLSQGETGAGAGAKGDEKKGGVPFLTREQVADLTFFVALGVVLGGRLGYVLFYNFGRFLEEPLSLFYVWQGGMSFHGGLLGVVLAIWLFCRRTGKSVFRILDFVAPLVPIGLGAGRLGNFIGAELWGRPTDVPWGMVFPGAGPVPRHPSQLYEFALEGVVLFIVLWWYSSRPRPVLAVAGLFVLLYGSFRFFVEFFRQPDEHLDFIAFDWVTMGQVLSAPMILVGALVLLLAYRNNTFARLETRFARAAGRKGS